MVKDVATVGAKRICYIRFVMAWERHGLMFIHIQRRLLHVARSTISGNTRASSCRTSFKVQTSYAFSFFNNICWIRESANITV